MINLKKLEINQRPIKEDYKLPGITGVHKLYNLPLKNLKFNPYNDRFAAQIFEYQSKKPQLGFDEESQQYLFDLLLKENPFKKQITKDDILKKGLIEPLVVEKRGIVLDGNRRLMILRDIIKDKNLDLKPKERWNFNNPAVVVLDVDVNITETKIREIETTLNIASDSPLEYKPINIYLKVMRLLEVEENLEQHPELKFSLVADKMGTKYKPKDIKEYQNVFKEMETYLHFFKRPQQYTLLELREDHFKQINKFKKGLKSRSLMTKYKVNDLDVVEKVNKIIYYLTSILWEGKKFREIFPKSDKKTFLSEKDKINILWKKMQMIGLEEYCLKNPGQRLLNSEVEKDLKKFIETLQDDDKLSDSEKLIHRMEICVSKLQKESIPNADLQKRLEKIIKTLVEINQTH